MGIFDPTYAKTINQQTAIALIDKLACYISLTMGEEQETLIYRMKAAFPTLKIWLDVVLLISQKMKVDAVFYRGITVSFFLLKNNNGIPHAFLVNSNIRIVNVVIIYQLISMLLVWLLLSCLHLALQSVFFSLLNNQFGKKTNAIAY